MSLGFYTIGMAGHIDHGKTSLTKALTNIDTDRLKEEKEKGISIELGYAPLVLTDEIQASIVDVPGHERFIRQMIAGVAGIDLVILVVAADEGVMPQTREHLEILKFLGVKDGIVAITKIDRVEEDFIDLVKSDIEEQLIDTPFENSPMVLVDSLSKKGIEELKACILKELQDVDVRDAFGAFRLPIDQVFSIQGIGTIARGTVYEGMVEKGSYVKVLPGDAKVKVRQIQVHHQDADVARAGQRAAINLGGINKSELNRGDVIVSSDQFIVSDQLDIALKTVDQLDAPIKQRAPIKLHIGTSEVMGKVVFFDRNELTDDTNEVLCQVRLEHPVVTKRGDRFILRRPTPVETIGGGWVIDPKGERYRFGEQTIEMLSRKKEGTPEGRVIEVLDELKVASLNDLLKRASLDEHSLNDVIETAKAKDLIGEMPAKQYFLTKQFYKLEEEITQALNEYHQENPMRPGMNKAEIVQNFKGVYTKKFVEYVIDELIEQNKLTKSEQYLQTGSFTPAFPGQWAKRMTVAVDNLKQDKLEVHPFDDYLDQEKIPNELREDMKHFLIHTKKAYMLDEKHLVHAEPFMNAVTILKQKHPERFALKAVKDEFGLSRKYLIPLLELMDDLGLTTRDDKERKWVQ